MEERRSLGVILVILVWFVWNITIGVITKWVLLYGQVCTSAAGCQTFKFPLATTVIHMTTSWAACYIYIFYIRRSLGGRVLDRGQQLRKIGPLAVFFASSVALGNLSLNFLYPSFKQMVGSGAPVVTVAMQVMFTQTRYNAWTWGSMPLICGGLWLCTTGEVNFHFFGFVYALGSMVLRSAKTIVQAQLLSKEERIDPVTLLYYMSPLSGAMVFVLSLAVEGFTPYYMMVAGSIEYFQGSGEAASEAGRTQAKLLLLIIGSGLNACFLNLSGFLVTRSTSAVTLQVLGSLKSCLGIAFSVFVFRNSLKLNQAVGVGICILGVWIYESRGGSIKVDKKVEPDPSKHSG